MLPNAGDRIAAMLGLSSRTWGAATLSVLANMCRRIQREVIDLHYTRVAEVSRQALRGSEGWCEQELAAGAWDSEPLVKNGLNIRVVSDVYDCFFTVSVRCRRATSAGDKRCGDRVAPLSRRDTARG